MAGDWIPIEETTPRKAEVMQIVAQTSRSRHEVVGLLIEFWLWTSQNTHDGNINVPMSALPHVIGADDVFWSAVADAGWLERRTDGIYIPRADHWLINSAKSRLMNTRRQKIRRAVVAPSSLTKRDKRATTEQKRTEEKNSSSNNTSPRAVSKTDATAAAAAEISAALLSALDRAGVGDPTRMELAAQPGVSPSLIRRCQAQSRDKGVGALVENIRAAARQAVAQDAASRAMQEADAQRQEQSQQDRDDVLAEEAERNRVIAELSADDLEALRLEALAELPAWERRKLRDVPVADSKRLKIAIHRLVQRRQPA